MKLINRSRESSLRTKPGDPFDLFRQSEPRSSAVISTGVARLEAFVASNFFDLYGVTFAKNVLWTVIYCLVKFSLWFVFGRNVPSTKGGQADPAYTAALCRSRLLATNIHSSGPGSVSWSRNRRFKHDHVAGVDH